MQNPYLEASAASHYDKARTLPTQTTALWMAELQAALPASGVAHILDLGCGTGRFSAALAKAFNCPVTGVEPSAAMLAVAKAQELDEGLPAIEWKQGDAAAIPLPDQAVDLVFMSQVFHHLRQPETAAQEIARALRPGGFLAIRNGTQETDGDILWRRFFPETIASDEKRIPTREQVKATFISQGLALLNQRTIQQLFTTSYQDYYNNISQRGLSALLALPDDVFASGLRRLQQWTRRQPADQPVYELIDLFIFRKA